MIPNLSQYFPITDPTLIFFVVLLIILCAPIIMGKLRIPHIIGMVLAGVIVGKYGLNILVRDNSFELFGRVGLYYILFLAALEMDMEGFIKRKYQMVVFGVTTFLIPFILTYFMGIYILNYGNMTSLLLSSIMASNTLIAYPIISRYGLHKKPSVTLSVGGSMFSLMLSLILLAAVVASFEGNSTSFWGIFILKLTAFCTFIIYLIPRLTRWFLRRYSDAVMQFVFVMSVLFMSASLSGLIGLEGLFGAFMAGLIMNRYIPHVSPLMNRIEFIGNALFIPYFLIGVGMLINLRLLFQGGGIIFTVLCIVFFGTIGKAAAAYAAKYMFKLPTSSANMIFGLTSAHAAGAIAMALVGMKLSVGENQHLITDDILNGIVIMILFTCIISSLITEYAAKQITLRDKEIALEDFSAPEEKILIPVKYPEYANQLVNLAILMRNQKTKNELVGLNVVYDGKQMRSNQQKGLQLLEQITDYANSADVRMVTQVRIAANIANGITRAFKEFQASEIIIGMHSNKNISPRFWGEFHQSLFNGLNEQIIMAKLNHPLSIIRRIQVAVPSRAQYELGFTKWLERLARLAGNLECRILFHGRADTLSIIGQYIRNHHSSVRAEYHEMTHWNEMPQLASTIAEDHLFVVVTARKGTLSYKHALDRLPEEVTRYFKGKNLLIIFPDQYGDAIDAMTFAEPQHQEEHSAYMVLKDWIEKNIRS